MSVPVSTILIADLLPPLGDGVTGDYATQHVGWFCTCDLSGCLILRGTLRQENSDMPPYVCVCIFTWRRVCLCVPAHPQLPILLERRPSALLYPEEGGVEADGTCHLPPATTR